MIDYERAKRLYPKQKSELTWAIRQKSLSIMQRVCRTAVKEWNSVGAWPDDWAQWQSALRDLGDFTDIGEL